MAKSSRKTMEKVEKKAPEPIKSALELHADFIVDLIQPKNVDLIRNAFLESKGKSGMLKSSLQESKTVDAEIVRKVSRIMEVADLTGFSKPFMEHFYHDHSIESLAEIALKYPSDRLAGIAVSVSEFPGFIHGKNVEERRTNLVAHIEKKLNELQPAAVKQRLRAELLRDHVLEGAPTEVKNKFYELYTKKVSDWPSIQIEAKKDKLLKEVIKKLDVGHLVNDLAGDFAPLVKCIEPRDSIHAIARDFKQDKVEKAIPKEEIPEETPGKTVDEKRKAIVSKFETGLFRLAPMATVARMLDSNDLAIPGGKQDKAVVKFLDNVTEFDFRRKSVYDAFHENGAFDNIPEANHEDIKENVKTLVRVSNLAPVSAAMPRIVETGLISAHLITNMPLKAYVRKYQQTFGETDVAKAKGAEEAKKVYRNAENIAIRNEHTLMALREAVSGSGIRMIDEMHSTSDDAGGAAETTTYTPLPLPMEEIKGRLPNAPPATYELLFGNVDLCECDECNSVYSAAAYYVELLQYLRNNNLDEDARGDLAIKTNNPKDISNTPLEKLFRRRPDLGDLQLTCRNLNTVLPYIDLVNEVMESFVVYHDDYANDTHDPKQDKLIAYNVEEDETTSELKSEPAHTNYKAYCILKKEVYPFTLPYHQPIDEARIFLDYLGTSRYELLKHFRSVMPPLPAAATASRDEVLPAYEEMLRRATDAEYLGLTEEEYVILTKEGFSTLEKRKLETNNKNLTQDEYLADIRHKKVWEYYGFKNESDLKAELKKVKPAPELKEAGFLKRTGLLYTDLVDLLKTHFINPNYPNGKALAYLKSIKYSYRYLQTLLIGGATGFAKYVKVVEKLQEQNKKDGSKYEDIYIQQWVCKYFERVGKIIVLENGSGDCSCVEGAFYKQNYTTGHGLSLLLISYDGGSGGHIYINSNCEIIFRVDGGLLPMGHLTKGSGEIIIDEHYQIIDSQAGTKMIDQLSSQNVSFKGASGEFGRVREGKLLDQNGQPLCRIIPETIDYCDITKDRLQHLDGTPLDEDDYADYDRMHRFIRLWRKLGWTIDEVDKAMMGLGATTKDGVPIPLGSSQPGDTPTHPDTTGPDTSDDCDDCDDCDDDDGADDGNGGTDGSGDPDNRNECKPDKGDAGYYDITPELLKQLAAVKKLQKKTGLELAKLLTFWTDISTLGEKSLYKRLFLPHNMLGLDKAFKDDGFGNYLSGPAKIAAHRPILMAALRLKSEDIDSILAHAKRNDADLTLANVSLLYRYSLLAKTLGTRVDDMLEAMDLLKPVAEPFRDARATVKFFDVYQNMEDSGMKPELLHYIVNDEDNPRKPHAPKDKTIYNLAQSLRDALLKIESDHPNITPETELTEELLRAKTSLFYSAEVVDKIVGLLNGTTVYADNTRRKFTLVPQFDDKKADKVVDDFKTHRENFEANPEKHKSWENFLARVQYAKNAGLQIKGILPDDDIKKVEALTKDTNFGTAVKKILAQPGRFFHQELQDIFPEPETAEKILLQADDIVDSEEPSDTVSEGKKWCFLKDFMPYLRKKLQEQVIIQQLATAMGIEEKMSRLLLMEVIVGQNTERVYDELLQLKEQQDSTTAPPPTTVTSWKGYLIPAADGDYTFQIESMTDVKLKIDGKPVLGKSIKDDEGIQTYTSSALTLQSGHAYPFEISGFEKDAFGNIAYFSWKTGQEKYAPVPANALFPDLHTEDFRQNYIRLQKAVWVINGLNLKADEVKYLLQYAYDFDDVNFNTLKDPAKDFSLKHWLRLYEYTHLREGLLEKDFTLLDFFQWIKNPDGKELEAQIAKLMLRKKEEIHKLIAAGHFNFLKIEDFKNEIQLKKMKATLEVADKIGMDIDRLFDWAKPTSRFKTTRVIAEGIRNATRARYEQDEWEEVVKPLMDKLREDQKQALIAYLLVQKPLIEWGVVDADSLFEFFLIDVQMDACMETSRIKQAISSVQLFVQRCFLGLETPYGIGNEVLDRDRWEWMQRYRIWEANRKVFLYPENWIEANLRDDKSPFFKELESELLQKDISKDNVTDALKAYLYKVDEVANMEVVGLYIDGTQTTNSNNVTTWSEGAKLHVFSRTRNAPYFFFYRYLALDEMNWYPWEKMQVDIPSYDVEDSDTHQITGNGCYLTPVVWKGRLLVFFPQFMKKTKPNDAAGNKSIVALSNDSPNNSKPTEGWEIKMAWSEYRNGKWTQKQLSKDAVYDIPVIDEFFQSNMVDKINVTSQAIENNDTIISNTIDRITPDLRFSSKASLKGPFGDVKNYFQNIVSIPVIPNLTDSKFSNINIAISSINAAISSINSKLFGDGIGTGVVTIIKLIQDNIDNQGDTFNDTEFKNLLVFINNESILIKQLISNAGKSLVQLTYSTKAFAPEPIPDISKYEFVPSINGQLLISVFFDAKPINPPESVFLFTGTQLSKSNISPVDNSVIVDNFHYIDSTIQSLQISNESTDYKFVDAADGPLLNHDIFYYEYSGDLLGMINNEKKLTEFFGYNLGLYTPDEAFGMYNNINTGFLESYHELKRSYSLYSWELFFHTPTMLADALSKSQQFEEAMKWYHYVFNPQIQGSETNRFWQFFPFRHTNAQNVLEQIFNTLEPNTYNQKISEWRDKPFRPHVVARSRPVAYMKYVVMKYLDNLIAWGDYLFRQDTIESINQATQLYILAGHILGPKPQFIPKKGKIAPRTYNQLLDRWDAFSNAMVEMEMLLPYSSQVDGPQDTPEGEEPSYGNIFGFGTSLYFCIPGNPKLLGYWKTVEDRLYKIRHCENMEGVFRMLPLFEPPIDPAIFVLAAAQGLSISSVLNDLNTPMPNYRFNYLLQKALELCGELKSLSNALVSAREKRDNEALSLLRAKHESHLQELIMEIKKQQLEEAQKNIAGLRYNRKAPEYRLMHYKKLLGIEPSPVAEDADFKEITDSNLYPDLAEESGYKVTPSEKEEMDKSLEAQFIQTGVGIHETLAGIFNALPSFTIDGKPFGVGGGTSWGFPNLGSATQAVARGLQVHAGELTYASSNAGKKTGFLRQLQDRVFQANLAGHEIKQIDRQITTQKIREHIANLEINNHQQVIDNSKEVEDFLRNKYSNQELYQWMDGQIKAVYRQVYNLAFELAKKAEKVYRFEKSLASSNFIQAGYWDVGRDGLMSGERLYLALKQMESAYTEDRGHDYEITKDVSLRQLDPMALILLKETGTCEFEIPETLFDMDRPGDYKRRIKSVSVTIPCVVGPYSSLNCTLRLLKHEYRNDKLAKTAPEYPKKTEETDERFVTDRVPITAIAVSQGQNDSGVFELNFKDERFMPFEGAGAISTWRLELPNEFRQFDYDTISDVVLQMRYTSCEGGGGLKGAALSALISYVNSAEELSRREGLFRMASLRHEFATEWYRFLNPVKPPTATDPHVMELGSLYDRLPFFTKYKSITKVDMNAFIVVAPLGGLTIKLCGPKDATTGVRAISRDITSLKGLGLLTTYSNMDLSENLKDTTWFLEIAKSGGGNITAAEMKDVFIVIRYSLTI